MPNATTSIPTGPPSRSVAPSVMARMLLPAVAWGLVAVLAFALPDRAQGFVVHPYARLTHWLYAGMAGFLFLIALVSRYLPALRAKACYWAPWVTVLAVFTGLWELLTAKLGILPIPFFQPPSALLEVYLDDWPRLGASLLSSCRLLAAGFFCGALAGFVTGVAAGWMRSVGYWVHPILRFIGPLPSTALLPMAFYFFPSGFSAGVFLIAMATWFPMTVLTWSGISSVDPAYYDVARTMGASEWFLIRRVAVPAALPSVFVGLFMGLGASFAVLVAAEMMGVKSGLGWYLQWAQGWGAYNNMYAALIVMALLFSSLITLLFAIRDRVLTWQPGEVQW
ncbi:ABC transporter permease [Oecophyllibacter saccharovorans]|uniref:ABC transporter permease n=1 Tax=Oecophyllibacter saccharovorans TaxID=2558360 RepID=UPI001F4FAAF6|nr:ABC transporter permease subunit [Oecophyllibacter saccharovorans]